MSHLEILNYSLCSISANQLKRWLVNYLNSNWLFIQINNRHDGLRSVDQPQEDGSSQGQYADQCRGWKWGKQEVKDKKHLREKQQEIQALKKKRKKVQKRLEEISVSFYSIVLCLQKWTHTYTHTASNLPNSRCWTTQAAEFLPLFTLEWVLHCYLTVRPPTRRKGSKESS